MNTTKAIILAAGLGSRLGSLTEQQPKCLLAIQGKTLIAGIIENLREVGVTDIVVVVGHQAEAVKAALGDSVSYHYYANYATTNNMHTMWDVRAEFDQPAFVLFADLIFDKEILRRLMVHEGDIALAVNTAQVREGTMRVQLDASKQLVTGIGSQIAVAEGDGNFLGIAQFSAPGSARLFACMEKMLTTHRQDYYTYTLHELAQRHEPVKAVAMNGYQWLEIDTPEDLKKCQQFLA